MSTVSRLLSSLQSQTAQYADVGRPFPTFGAGSLGPQLTDLQRGLSGSDEKRRPQLQASVTARLSAVIRNGEGDASEKAEQALRLVLALPLDDLLVLRKRVHDQRWPVTQARLRTLFSPLDDAVMNKLYAACQKRQRTDGTRMTAEDVRQCLSDLERQEAAAP